MHTLSRIISSINKNEKLIIEDIDLASIKAYEEIQDLFLQGNIDTNDLFQSKFNSFYRLNGAALTKEFKSAYYKTMEENRHNEGFENWKIKEILLELFKYENYQGNKCIHFSFTTKLMHTINNDLPIYDSMIKKVFGFKGPHYYNNTNERINIYLTQYEAIKETYKQIIENNILNGIVTLFGNKFANFALSKIKTLDFIFWTEGKLEKN